MFKDIVILLFVVLQCHYAATGCGQSIALSGADWRIHEDADGKGIERKMFEGYPSAVGWIAATVPGNIQADLEASRLIAPYWFDSTDVLLAKPPASGAPYGLADMFKRCDFTVRGGDPRFVDVVLGFVACGLVGLRQFVVETGAQGGSPGDLWHLCSTVIWKGGDNAQIMETH